MSALGQKRTSRHVPVMSALPPKADIAPSTIRRNAAILLIARGSGTLPMRPIIPPRLEAVIRSRMGASPPPPEDPRWQADGRDPSEMRGATSRARRREIPVYPSPVMLPRAEIKRTLLRFRYNREFRGPRRVPIKTLADHIGLSPETLYQAMRGSVSDRTQAVLSWAIIAIREGRLRFHRSGQRWSAEASGGLLCLDRLRR